MCAHHDHTRTRTRSKHAFLILRPVVHASAHACLQMSQLVSMMSSMQQQQQSRQVIADVSSGTEEEEGEAREHLEVQRIRQNAGQ